MSAETSSMWTTMHKKNIYVKYNQDAPRNCGPPVGIYEVDFYPNNIELFPNPNIGQFTVQSSKAGQIKVYSSNGRLIYNQIVQEENTEVILQDNIPDGMYFVQLISDQGAMNKKNNCC